VKTLVTAIVSLLVAAHALPRAAWAIDQAPHLAIINDSETATLADQMLATLSKRPDVALLEREQISRALREQHAQLAGLGFQDSLRLGKLLKADGLLIVSAPQGEKLVVARLVAVDPGVILWSWRLPQQADDTGNVVETMVSRLSTLLPKLSVSREAAVPISVLNLRNAVGGPDAAALERELTELLIDRLAHEPAVFVLERQKMALLGFEKEFLSATTNEFWTGRYLLDGTITKKGSNIVVDARLQSSTATAPLAFQQSGQEGDTKALVDRLAQKVMVAIRTPSRAVDWQPQDEARQFAEEAKWALRWQAYDQMRSASESAWALGDRSDSLKLLRTQSYAESAIAATRDQQRPLDVQSIEWSVHSLELYRDVALAGQSRAAPYDVAKIKRGLDFLVIASEVLLSAHKRLVQPTPDEREALAELRKLCRETASRLVEETKAHPEVLKASAGESDFPKDGLEPNTGNIDFVRAVYGTTWYDNALQALELHRQLLEDRHGFDRNLRVQVSLLFVKPGMNSPKMIDWSSPSQVGLEALWDKLVEELCASANSEEQVLGHSIHVARKRRLLRNTGGAEQVQPAIEQLIDTLWNQREAIARQQVDGRVVADAIDTMRNIVTDAGDYSIKGIHGGALIDLRKRLYAYLVPQHEHYSDWLWGGLFEASDYSPDESRKYFDLIETYRKSAPDADKLAWHQHLLHQKLEPPRSTKSRPDIPESLPVRQFWKSPIGEIHSVLRDGDRLYALGHSIAAIDPDSLRTDVRELPWLGGGRQDASLAVARNRLFVSTGTNIWSCTWEQGNWQKLDLPKDVHGKIWAIGDSLYVCAPSAIYRVRLVDSSVELLASARRRPALTPLDDFPPFAVQKIFRISDDTLCVEIAGQWFFSYSERTGTWKRLGANSDAIYSHKINRDLLLSAIGVDQYNPHDETCGSVYLLMLDVYKNAEPSDVPHKWPPDLFLDGVVRSHIWGAAVQGRDLWVLFHSSVYMTCLRYSPARGLRDAVIPINVEIGQERYSPLCAMPKHLVVCGWDGLWFIPMNELDNYIQQHYPEIAAQKRQSP
jgi:TolB-like protein